MATSLVGGLPYTPESHPIKVGSMHHLKYALDDLVAPGDIRSRHGAPFSLAGSRLVGGGVMLEVTVQAGTEVRHEHSHLSALDSDDVLATLVLEGGGGVTQGSVDLPFQAGDVFYRKARLPSAVRIDHDCRLLLLRFSFSRFNAGHRSKFSDFIPALSKRDSPLRRMLWTYVEQVLPSLADGGIDMVAHAEQAFVSLLSAVYAEAQQAAPEHAKSKRAVRWDVLVSTLDTLMFEPDLSVARLSRALGVSARLVHSLFQANGHRYGIYLLEKRLERARADLFNPQHAALSVADIAYRAGFNNPSHFSRSFKQRYGAPPAQYRQDLRRQAARPSSAT